jgi:D-tagatose-1,6-bisphosphate aldolase subunit GatZ/KbaZ
MEADVLSLKEIVARLIKLREERGVELTLLAVCPNSEAVLEAAVQVAAANGMPMLFAATLNQVDRDGGYTGWTPAAFVGKLDQYGSKYGCRDSLYPCLDHGGPWLKDRHTLDRLTLEETFAEVRRSLTACLEAGYALLHIDATVDRSIAADRPMPIDLVTERTIELVEHCERERGRLGLPPVSYEVGTEEVHGGLVDLEAFRRFVEGLRSGLAERDLLAAWPAFIVGKVGTDLHTTYFDPAAARRLYEIVAPLGSLPKGHYTDWVENVEDYPRHGMGGANVGPEFTAEEYLALAELARREADLRRAGASWQPAGIMEALEAAVVASGRWQKWLQPEEQGLEFRDLSPERRDWLVQTGARYIWTQPDVVAAREGLYNHLAAVMPNPGQFVVERIARSMERYVGGFRLFGSSLLLGASA